MGFFKNIVIGIALLSVQAFSCAGGWWEIYVKDEYYDFLDPTLVNIDTQNPLYKLSSAYGAHGDRWNHFKYDIEPTYNIETWSQYFGARMTKEEIKELFYDAAPIQEIYKKYKAKIDDENFDIYIDFLSLQMPFAIKSENQKLSSNYDEVVTRGISLLTTTQDKFLKERYLFLVMRLYHYYGHYREELALYEKYKAIVTKGSIADEWIVGLIAGALESMDKKVEANMLYAKIFATHKVNPYLGYYDFKVRSDAQWQSMLSLTKNEDEKALLYFLRAMHWQNSGIKELESISKVAPQSIWFDRLSYMVMQDLQRDRYAIMENEFYGEKIDEIKKSYDEQVAYYKNILERQKEPSFFTLYVKLYLDMLDYKPLEQERFKQLQTKASQNEQIYVKLIGYLDMLNQTRNLKQQEKLATAIKPILSKVSERQQRSLLRYSVLQLATLYPKGSTKRDILKLYANSNMDDYPYVDSLWQLVDANADEFEHYITEKNRPFFEQKVYEENVQNLSQNDLYKIASLLFMQDNDFKKANVYLTKIQDYNNTSLYNPFNTSISGNNRSGKKGAYTQKKFAKVMLELQQKIQAGSKDPMDHYLYATGLYNKSWFGSFPLSATIYRSVYLRFSGSSSFPKSTDLSLAQKEYKIALQNTNKKEFKAQIAYQLLKIDLANACIAQVKENGWFYGFGWSVGMKEMLRNDKNFSSNIIKYKDEYGDTQYGKEVIKSCVSFRFF
jgi:hypothetical protein